MNNKQVCAHIFQFIYKELEYCIEDYVFDADSFEELGQAYFERIINADSSISEDNIKAILSSYLTVNISAARNTDYYKALCDFVGIKDLPKSVKTAVQQKYDEIFEQKRCTVFAKYDAAINQISIEENQTNAAENSVFSNRTPKNINYDITSEETILLDLYLKRDELRSRKDSLMFIKGKTEEFLLRFCDYNNSVSVENAVRRKSLELCKNDIAQLQTIFSPYETYLSCLEDDIDRPYALFFKIKLYQFYEKARSMYHTQSFNLEKDIACQNCEKYLNKLPAIDSLHTEKATDSAQYLSLLRDLMSNYNLVAEIKKAITESVCLRNRKSILLRTISLFESGEYDLIIGLLPTQIEGIFADLLIDMTTYSRFSDLNLYPHNVLKEKIDCLLNLPDSIYLEAAEYFHNYYNNMVRNPVAHGRYYGNNDNPIMGEITAREHILDLGSLVYMLSRISETEKFFRFIKDYIPRNTFPNQEQPTVFGALFHDITAQRTHYDYDTVETYRPLHIAYWIVNPYYEKIYKSVDDGEDLYALRQMFLSAEFWSYVLEMLNHSLQKIDGEFGDVVRNLFRCNLSDETKTVLAKVNDKYRSLIRGRTKAQ